MAETNLREILARQFRASLAMLREAVLKCPESLWLAPEYPNKFWHIAYHVLYCTHVYLQNSEKESTPWKKHRQDYQWLVPLPWPPHDRPKIGTPYTKEEILEYLQICREEIDVRVPCLDFNAPSGFSWLPFGKLELQLYNLRHLQHHTGQLVDRLRTAAQIGIAWVAAI
ncbi:MAG: DinB family protein [Terriglobia bacterium]